jgi:cyclophilin family peptidyl-prolyl cis-trans isomerase/HEAT repeat protein
MTATRDGAGPARPAAGPQERWCGLFALARRKAARARSLFVHAARTGDARERIFAAQGLGAVPADENSLAVLRALLADPDWRVAAEAASALGKHADVRSVAALGGAARREVPSHAAQHLRAAAATALGTHGSAVTEALAALEAPLADVSPNVRGAALIAWARLAPESARAAVERAAADEDSITRAAAALACPHLHWGHAQPILERLLADAIPRVRAMAGEALGQTDMHAGVSAMLRDLLESDDNALRLAAALAHPESAAALNEELLACLETTHGEIAAEVAQACVAAAAKMPGNLGQRILEKAARHTDPYVARRARALLGERFPDVELPDSPARRAAPEELPPLVWDTNPIVHVETSRGTLTFELYPDETPAHVWNLLELARAGHYDGLTFHRVVPDFVIQGGDHRGDGNGGVTWNGAPLLAELGPRPFVRGSLGMPRNDDPDSGGSQLFVTHRETPHLDGHYTLFGQLTAGFDVLDSIEVGDRIVSVRVEEPAASTPSSGD